MGAAFGLLGDDLHERLMLGDTGANVIGAALGLGVVLGTEESTRIATMLVLLALNVAAEMVSFSDVIDRVAPFRWFDRLGRRPSPAVAPGVQRERPDGVGPVPLRFELPAERREGPEVTGRGDDDAADLA